MDTQPGLRRRDGLAERQARFGRLRDRFGPGARNEGPGSHQLLIGVQGMRISELAQSLGLEVAQGGYADREISTGYSSDLLSDVMANAKADGVLVTVQAHKNAVAVASLVGLAAVVVCNSRPLPDDMVEAA